MPACTPTFQMLHGLLSPRDSEAALERGSGKRASRLAELTPRSSVPLLIYLSVLTTGPQNVPGTGRGGDGEGERIRPVKGNAVPTQGVAPSLRAVLVKLLCVELCCTVWNEAAFTAVSVSSDPLCLAPSGCLRPGPKVDEVFKAGVLGLVFCLQTSKRTGSGKPELYTQRGLFWLLRERGNMTSLNVAIWKMFLEALLNTQIGSQLFRVSL